MEFGTYIDVLGSVLYPIERLRFHKAKELYNISEENYFEGSDEWRKIRDRYLMRIIEFSENEKRLIKLMEKQQSF